MPTTHNFLLQTTTTAKVASRVDRALTTTTNSIISLFNRTKGSLSFPFNIQPLSAVISTWLIDSKRR